MKWPWRALAASAMMAALCGGAGAQPLEVPDKSPAGDPPESVEADISTRSVAVTSNFTGTQIIVFGSVHNSRQKAPDEGLYDLVVIVEGVKGPLVARRKSKVGGIWINTDALRFEDLPSYYAIASTRPLAELASARTLANLAIGFDQVPMTPLKAAGSLGGKEIEDYRLAVTRLKQKDNLYIRKDYGVSFIGRGLFRTTVDVPANVPVGPLRARVYLFRDGQLLSRYSAPVRLEREGVERFLHTSATRYPLLYGLATVAIAAAAGLLASAFFRRAA